MTECKCKSDYECTCEIKSQFDSDWESELEPVNGRKWEYKRPPIEYISGELAKEFAEAVVDKLDLNDPRFISIFNNLLHLENVITKKFPGRQREETIDNARDKLLPAINDWARKSGKRTFGALKKTVEIWMWRAVNDQLKKEKSARSACEKSPPLPPYYVDDRKLKTRNRSMDGPHYDPHGDLKAHEDDGTLGAVELVLKLQEEHGLQDFECCILELLIESWSGRRIDRELVAGFGFTPSRARRTRETLEEKMRVLLHDKKPRK